jgi:predicted PurR-regulated permease PerM
MPSLPDWVVRLPVLGPRAAEAWEEIGMHNPAVMSRLQEFSGAVAMTGFGAALGVMRGLGLLALSVLFASLFYLGGENAAAGLLAGMQRIVGARAAYLLALVGKTVNGVVYGILGTSIVQGALCGVGYWIAGLPSPILLSWVTAFLAVIPGGPILIVLPGALWLAHVGHLGWGIFLVAWAVVVGVFSDNVLKPVLIGKSSRVPVILVMMGVLGGALAFGFLGAFIGPTLLAVAHAVLRQWAMGEPPPADGEMVPVADPRPRN